MPCSWGWTGLAFHCIIVERKFQEQTQTAKEITLDLIIRYGFQVLGAIIILAVGVLG